MSMTHDSFTFGQLESGTQDAWRTTMLLILALCLVVIVVYLDTALATVNTWWTSETYAHGLIIFPITGWMIWKHQGAIFPLAPEPALIGLLPIFILAMIWVPGHLTNVWLVQQVGLILMIPAIVFTLAGWRAAGAMAFPLAYLAFAIPVGESLIPSMMEFTAEFSVWALQVTGIPVYQEGRFISVPNGNFEVATACSGVRYLIASLALGCLYAYLTYQSTWRRLLFIVLAAIVPIIANGIRAYAIIMIAHLSDMKYAVGVDHLIFGWVFFGVVMFFLFWLGGFWQESIEVLQEAERVEPVPAKEGVRKRLLVAAVLMIPVILSGRFVADWMQARVDAQPMAAKLQAPKEGGEWKSTALQQSAGAEGLAYRWQPEMLGASSEIMSAFRDSEGRMVTVYIANYDNQQQDQELINSENELYQEDLWRETGIGNQAVQVQGGKTVNVDEILVRNRRVNRVIWRWYAIGDATATNHFHVKWLETMERMKGQRGAAMIALAAEYEIKPDQARETLGAFMRDRYPALQQTLVDTRAADSTGME